MLTTAAKAYRQEIDEGTVLIYFGALGRKKLDDVAEAVSRHLVDTQRGRFFPTVADIVEQVATIQREQSMRAPSGWFIDPSAPPVAQTRGVSAAEVLEQLGGSALSALAAAVSQTYATIRRKHGQDAAERWYWEQHVLVCNDTQRHGCRASLGRYMHAQRVSGYPSVDELMETTGQPSSGLEQVD